jgi:hypothetical protein
MHATYLLDLGVRLGLFRRLAEAPAGSAPWRTHRRRGATACSGPGPGQRLVQADQAGGGGPEAAVVEVEAA